MSDLPEKIWIDGGIAQQSLQDNPEKCVSPHGPYIHDNKVQALVAAAYEAAARACGLMLPENGAGEPQDLTDRLIDEVRRQDAKAVRALTPSDAQAALDAAIERAVRAERERCIARLRNVRAEHHHTGMVYILGLAGYSDPMSAAEAAIRKDTE